MERLKCRCDSDGEGGDGYSDDEVDGGEGRCKLLSVLCPKKNRATLLLMA